LFYAVISGFLVFVFYEIIKEIWLTRIQALLDVTFYENKHVYIENEDGNGYDKIIETKPLIQF
jgi:hypothetical protein